MIRVLVSACLLGEKVRYDGADAAFGSRVLGDWLSEGRVVAFCPEVAGGLGVPRPAAEIRGSGGNSVLDGTGRVLTRDGDDVTGAFVRGAELALQMARSQGVGLAILKEGSPSCGSSFIHDGSFTGQRKIAHGVTSALLERHGIRVFSEARLDEAADHLRTLERG
ncbi:MAG: DUF523 domain-containing protein [Vicinamibacteria bacterium]